jgi:hypothetical protein
MCHLLTHIDLAMHVRLGHSACYMHEFICRYIWFLFLSICTVKLCQCSLIVFLLGDIVKTLIKTTTGNRHPGTYRFEKKLLGDIVIGLSLYCTAPDNSLTSSQADI